MTEKVVGTRMDGAVVEKLEALAVLRDRTVSQLVRMAVERLLEAEERTLHPLSLEAVVSLGEAIGIETSLITANATSLTNASYGNAGGVYLLVHQETRELYVGSSTELTARLTHHKFSIKTGTHKNQSLNGWLVDDVVVVILESYEAVKSAETKRSLLEREQHYINTLKLSKDWTLLNIADASKELPKTAKTTVMGTRGTSNEPSPALENVNTPVLPPVKGTISPTAGRGSSSNPTAFETFYSTAIEQALIPILQEQSASRDVVRLFEGCKNETEKGWFLEFLRSYDSPWLTGLASSGKFPWIAKLLEN